MTAPVLVKILVNSLLKLDDGATPVQAMQLKCH